MPFNPNIGVAIYGPLMLDGGVNAVDDPMQMQNECPLILNMEWKAGLLQPRNCYTNLTESVSGSTIQTDINGWQGLHQAVFDDGTVFLVMHAPGYMLKYDGTTTSDLSGGVRDTGSISRPWAGIMGIGTAADPPTRYYCCDGESPLYSLTQDETFTSVSSYATFSGSLTDLIGRYLAGYAGRVFLGYTKESTTYYPQRLRWCADSDASDWRDAEDTGAGAADLADSPGYINGLFVAGPNLYVFKSDAILVGAETGIVQAPVSFPSRIDKRNYGGGSVQAVSPDTIVFLGSDGAYALSGGTVERISDKINPLLNFAKNGRDSRLWPFQERQIVSWLEPEENMYCVVMPGYYGGYGYTQELSNFTSSQVGFAMDLKSGKWYMREFPYGITAACVSRRGEIADRRATVPIIGMGNAASAMRLWGKDLGDGTEPAGRAAPYLVETPDIRLNPDGYATCYMLIVYFDTDSATARTWKASVSTDRGSTWANATKTISTSAKNQVWRQRIEKSGIWFRFRLQNNAYTDLPIGIRSMEVRFANRAPLI